MNSQENEKDSKPATGTIPEENKRGKRKYNHNHRRSLTNKKDWKIENGWIEYFKFMETNLRKQKHQRESPHIVISKSFKKIKKTP